MTFSKRILLIVAMMIIALISVACGGGGGTSGSPTDVAKTFVEGIFAGNANAIRSVVCESAKSQITDEGLQAITGPINMMKEAGGEVVLSGLTYTYDSNKKIVTISGEVKVRIAGQETALPMSLNDLFGNGGIPVLEEGGKWTVCPS